VGVRLLNDRHLYAQKKRDAFPRAGSVLGTDVLIHQRNRRPPGDGDRMHVITPSADAPGDAEPVEGACVDVSNVGGLVRELVADVVVPATLAVDRALCPVVRPAAVRVDEPSDETPAMGVDDLLLPIGQQDGACFLPGPCCGNRQGRCPE
jgi:hypothetical protein